MRAKRRYLRKPTLTATMRGSRGMTRWPGTMPSVRISHDTIDRLPKQTTLRPLHKEAVVLPERKWKYSGPDAGIRLVRDLCRVQSSKPSCVVTAAIPCRLFSVVERMKSGGPRPAEAKAIARRRRAVPVRRARMR
jgi:hypothetical protein